MPSAAMKAQLRRVEANPFAEVEAELQALCVELEAAKRAVAAVEARMLAARQRYAQQHGLKLLPRIELLRTRYAPPNVVLA